MAATFKNTKSQLSDMTKKIAKNITGNMVTND